jgi:hypothetical protein
VASLGLCRRVVLSDDAETRDSEVRSPDVLQIVMSALVALAGLFLVITAEGQFRVFGWFLLVFGVLGMVSPFVLRSLRRR